MIVVLLGKAIKDKLLDIIPKLVEMSVKDETVD